MPAGANSNWMATIIDVMVLLTVVTTVDELIGRSALALTFTISVALLLTGPLVAAVRVVTAGQPCVDIILTGLCSI